jgi:hypothetical protein
MIKKILNKFGYILKSESDEKLRGVHEMYESQISTLDREKNILELELIALRKKEEESKPIFDFNIGDPIPGGDARKGYVASVAGFYKDILEAKLKQMIAVSYTMLEETSNDRDFDLILKGVVYSFRDLMKWGEIMYNEQVANQTGDVEPDEKTLTEKIKELTQ